MVGITVTWGVTSITGRMVRFGGAAIKRMGSSQFKGTVPGRVLKIQGIISVASFTWAGMGALISVFVPAG